MTFWHFVVRKDLDPEPYKGRRRANPRQKKKSKPSLSQRTVRQLEGQQARTGMSSWCVACASLPSPLPSGFALGWGCQGGAPEGRVPHRYSAQGTHPSHHPTAPHSAVRGIAVTVACLLQLLLLAIRPSSVSGLSPHIVLYEFIPNTFHSESSFGPSRSQKKRRGEKNPSATG